MDDQVLYQPKFLELGRLLTASLTKDSKKDQRMASPEWTAAARLRRRQSEGGNPLPPAGSRPLPDIIPSGRDRAMSVPDLQTLARMQRAREVGRELRRLSDEFQFGTFLNSIHEEVDGQFPRLGVHLFSRPFTYFQAFLRHTFRRRRRPVISRRSTSVDLAGRLASMQLTEQSEDLPGD